MSTYHGPRALTGGKLTRLAATRLAAELRDRARLAGSYAQASHDFAQELLDNVNASGSAYYRRAGTVDRVRARFLGQLIAGAAGRRNYLLKPDPDAWTAHARERASGGARLAEADEAFRAAAEAYGRKAWGTRFELPALTYSNPAPAPAPAADPAPAPAPAPAPDPAPAPAPEPAPEQGQGQGYGLGLIPGHDSGRGASYAPDDPRRLDRARHVDRARVDGWARRMRGALAAAITCQREPDQASGRFVNRSALARLGAGATLRPFERLRRAHAPSTAIALTLDCSGSMADTAGHVDCAPDDISAARARARHATGISYSPERSASGIVAVRMAALAVSDACARTVPLRLSMFDDAPYTLADWKHGPDVREHALLTKYGALGGTNAPAAALDMLEALAQRREARRIAIMLCDGALGHRRDWEAIDERAADLGVELHVICADWPDYAKSFRADRALLPERIRERIHGLTMDTAGAAAEEIVATTEGALRREARAWAS